MHFLSWNTPTWLDSKNSSWQYRIEKPMEKCTPCTCRCNEGKAPGTEGIWEGVSQAPWLAISWDTRAPTFRWGNLHCYLCMHFNMYDIQVWIPIFLNRSCFIVQFKAHQNARWWIKVCFHGKRCGEFEHLHHGGTVYLRKADHGIKCMGDQKRGHLFSCRWLRDALQRLLPRPVSSDRCANCQALCRRLGGVYRKSKLVGVQICWNIFRDL